MQIVRCRSAVAVVGVVLVLMAGLGMWSVPAGASPAAPPPPPDDDPFYIPPAGFETRAPGSVLRSRPVTVTGLGVPLPVQAKQTLVRTTDSAGHPVATASTVLIPGIPFWFGKRPLVSYQAPTDSLGDQCEPSYTLRTGDLTSDLALLAPLLLKGYVVVVTDYQGPNHAYSAGRLEGHATLDGIRAAEQLPGTGLAGTNTPVGMWGYSGGAIATGWAAELQASYAPELNLKGAALGGTPADLLAVARYLDGGPFSGVELMASMGLAREYPVFALGFNDAGHAVETDLADTCGLGDAIIRYPFRHLEEFTVVPDPLNFPFVVETMQQVKLGSTAPAAPVYLYHAVLDEGIPFAQAAQLRDDWCTRGADVTFHADLLSDHVILGASGAPAAIAFLGDRFAARPTRESC
ncbi:MAG TPA: lipase family protein [Acidimicrobiales bacterium]|jgi:hypothetical protein